MITLTDLIGEVQLFTNLKTIMCLAPILNLTITQITTRLIRFSCLPAYQ